MGFHSPLDSHEKSWLIELISKCFHPSKGLLLKRQTSASEKSEKMFGKTRIPFLYFFFTPIFFWWKSRDFFTTFLTNVLVDIRKKNDVAP